MAQEKTLPSMDFDQLLDTNLEDLPEFVGFKQMPVGVHLCYATLTSELSKKDKTPMLKLALTVIETVETPENGEPAHENEEFAFMLMADTQTGIERIGSTFKNYMREAGIGTLRELLEQMVGVRVGIRVGSYTAKADANGVSKTYATIEELLPSE